VALHVGNVASAHRHQILVPSLFQGGEVVFRDHAAVADEDDAVELEPTAQGVHHLLDRADVCPIAREHLVGYGEPVLVAG